MSWTEDRVEALRKLWEEGHSASFIASCLGGVSRNAVIGKAHRLKLYRGKRVEVEITAARSSFNIASNSKKTAESGLAAKTPRKAALAKASPLNSKILNSKIIGSKSATIKAASSKAASVKSASTKSADTRSVGSKPASIKSASTKMLRTKLAPIKSEPIKNISAEDISADSVNSAAINASAAGAGASPSPAATASSSKEAANKKSVKRASTSAKEPASIIKLSAKEPAAKAVNKAGAKDAVKGPAKQEGAKAKISAKSAPSNRAIKAKDSAKATARPRLRIVVSDSLEDAPFIDEAAQFSAAEAKAPAAVNGQARPSRSEQAEGAAFAMAKEAAEAPAPLKNASAPNNSKKSASKAMAGKSTIAKQNSAKAKAGGKGAVLSAQREAPAQGAGKAAHKAAPIMAAADLSLKPEQANAENKVLDASKAFADKAERALKAARKKTKSSAATEPAQAADNEAIAAQSAQAASAELAQEGAGATFAGSEQAPTSYEESAEEQPQERRLTLLQLTEATCKWPNGDPLAEGFYFCGADTQEGSPYCRYHSRLAFNPFVDRRRKNG